MDNVFMQCSQTKGFCGVTIAKLVEEGRISLDDPVSKYLPEFVELWVLDAANDSAKTLRKAKNVLTIRMVLNHTGGFPPSKLVPSAPTSGVADGLEELLFARQPPSPPHRPSCSSPVPASSIPIRELTLVQLWLRSSQG